MPLPPPRARLAATALALAVALSSNGAGASATGGAWTPLDGPLDAPPRTFHATIYDPVRHRLLNLGDSDPNVLWELPLDDAVAWRVVTCAGSPPPELGGQSVVYDPVGDRLIVYGGLCNSVSACADGGVYALTLAGSPVWTRLAPSGPSPPSRSGQAAIYDPVGRRMIVFGGEDALRAPLGDLWALSLSDAPAWSEITPSGVAPDPRLEHALVYDSVHRRALLYGGWTRAGEIFQDTWALSLDGQPTWSELHPVNPLGPRLEAAAVYDPVQDRVLLTAGRDNYFTSPIGDTWQLTLRDPSEWLSIQSPVPAPTVYAHAAAIDPIARRLILTGGWGFPGDATRCVALGLDARPDWSTVEPAVPALHPGRTDVALAFFDAARERLLVLARAATFPFGTSLWSWSVRDGGWSLLPTTGEAVSWYQPAGWTYDSTRDRLLFFSGGYATYRGEHLDQAFALSLSGTPAWSRLAISGDTPPGRTGHSALYDPVRDRVIVFGGRHRVGPSDDTGFSQNDAWALALTSLTWAPLAVTGEPPPSRAGHQALYDAARDRMIVFEGEEYAGDYLVTPRSDAWSLDLQSGAWSPCASDVPGSGVALIDPGRDRIVVFGDRAVATWSRALDGSGGWTTLATAGSPAPPREGAGVVWDPLDDRAMLFGGRISDRLLAVSAPRGDLWSLDFGAPPAPAVTLQRADAASDHVALAWSAPPGLAATVQRWAAGAAAWTTLAPVVADGDGWLAFDDRAVTAGGRYRYRLDVRRRDEHAFGGQAEVVVPESIHDPEPLPVPPPEFALDGATPNPAIEGLMVAFSLPDAAPARFEVVDVSGRRVSSREVGSLGPGRHVVDLAAGRRLPAGVYVVRLSRGDRSLTRLASVIR